MDEPCAAAVLLLCDDGRGQASTITGQTTYIPPDCHERQSWSCVCKYCHCPASPWHIVGMQELLVLLGLRWLRVLSFLSFPRQINAESHLPMCSRIPTGNVVCKLESSWLSTHTFIWQDICLLEEFTYSKIIVPIHFFVCLFLILPGCCVVLSIFFCVLSKWSLHYFYLSLLGGVYWVNLLWKTITHGCFALYFYLSLFSVFHCWLDLKAFCVFINSVTRHLMFSF